MVIAVYDGNTFKTVYGLWQWDYGQTLRIQGLNLPDFVEVHFALKEKGGTSVSRIGITKDGVTDVIIPDSMLENEGTLQDYKVYAFIYLSDEQTGMTVKEIIMFVRSRSKPEIWTSGDKGIFHEAINAVRESAKIAQESAASAKEAEEEIKKLSETVKIIGETAKETEQEIEKDRIAVQKMVEELENTIMIPISEDEIQDLYKKKEETQNE